MPDLQKSVPNPCKILEISITSLSVIFKSISFVMPTCRVTCLKVLSLARGETHCSVVDVSFKTKLKSAFFKAIKENFPSNSTAEELEAENAENQEVEKEDIILVL